MAVGTLLSRITGFIRTAALVSVLGITELGDAFNTANTIPTMLLVLVTGGTLSSVLIPMLAREPDLAKRRHNAETIGGLVIVGTGLAAVVTLAAAPLVARVFALGVTEKPYYDQFVAITAQWLMLFAPQILFYGISVYAVAVLSAHGRLALAGFAPVATNLVALAAIVAFVQTGGPSPPSLDVGTTPLLVLGLGTSLSIAAMAIPQLYGAKRVLPGLRLRPRLRLRDPATRELWRLGRWTLGYVAANQIGLAVVIALANSVNGGVIAYQTAFAIMQLPFAIIAVSLFSAIYPRLARTAERQGSGFADTVSGGLRLSATLLIPAAVGLFVLAGPVADLLVGYGAAAGAGAEFVGVALRIFALALLPFSVFQLLTRSHYALPDARTPALANVAVNIVNIVAALVAFAVIDGPRERIAGLVGAYALSYLAGCTLLGAGLVRRRPGAFAGAVRGLLTAAGAALAMALAIWVLQQLFPLPQGGAGVCLHTAVLIVAGGVVYVLGLVALRSRELRELVSRRGV